MNKKILATLLLIGIAFLFYWFEIRPASIRKGCLIRLKEESVSIYSFEDEPDTYKRGRLQDQYIDQYYKDCIHEAGLAQ